MEQENKKGVAWIKWQEMVKLTNFVKINNHKLKEHTKSNQTAKMEPSAKTVNNQGPLTAFEKRPVLDVWLGSELTPEKLT